jgi:CheY-like chemotaxis protein
MKTLNILLVNCKEVELDALVQSLSSEYEVSTLTEGSKCYQQAKDIQPDLILLGYEIEDVDSISICIQLKNDPKTQAIPIVFISEKTTLKNRLIAYDAGAEDFIQRPYETPELIVKTKLILSYNQDLRQSKQESIDINTVLSITSTELSEIASIIDFFRRSFSIRSIEKLADSFLKVILEYNLSATLFICTLNECQYVSSNRYVTEKDKLLFQEKGDHEKIHSFGESTIFNFKHFNLLVQKMSVDNPEKYGRDKDNIALLGEGIDARIVAINYEQAQIKQALKRQHVIEQTTMALSSLNELQEEQQQQEAAAIIDWLAQKMEDSFLSLGLSDPQEEHLMTLVDTVQQRSNKLFKKNEALSQHLEAIMTELQNDIELSELLEEPEEDHTEDLNDDGFMIF